MNPLACSNIPSEAEMMPLPREEVTPPVTNMYLAEEVMNWPKNMAAKVDYLRERETRIPNLFHLWVFMNKFA